MARIKGPKKTNRHEIFPSMNRPGCCQDNAHMESFFHTLKGELIRNRTINEWGQA